MGKETQRAEEAVMEWIRDPARGGGKEDRTVAILYRILRDGSVLRSEVEPFKRCTPSLKIAGDAKLRMPHVEDRLFRLILDGPMTLDNVAKVIFFCTYSPCTQCMGNVLKELKEWAQGRPTVQFSIVYRWIWAGKEKMHAYPTEQDARAAYKQWCEDADSVDKGNGKSVPQLRIRVIGDTKPA